jgi:hypothetical protein
MRRARILEAAPNTLLNSTAPSLALLCTLTGQGAMAGEATHSDALDPTKENMHRRAHPEELRSHQATDITH